ncbi:MAG TPA: acyltransferase domain-containing protein [Clostridia bacterium]|nr:acyltransferase domain-containing protein [Clostridia bacterium]
MLQWDEKMEQNLISCMQTLGFPQESQDDLLACNARLEALPETCAQLDAQVISLVQGRGPVSTEVLDAIATLLGVHHYTLHLLFLLRAAIPTRAQYALKGLDEAIYWDSVRDLLYKLAECRVNAGVTGTMVMDWHLDFFRLNRFALGRLQYEEIPYRFDRYQRHGVTLYAGETVLNTHIPSSGPLGREERLDSYRRAYDFYKCAERGVPLAVICSSWLLFPDNRLFFPKRSNILDFMDDFDLLFGQAWTPFHDAWRVFGPAHEKPLDQWPADTALRKAYVDWFKAGRWAGYGVGILVFDGEKLLSGPRAKEMAP